MTDTRALGPEFSLLEPVRKAGDIGILLRPQCWRARRIPEARWPSSLAEFMSKLQV